MFYVVLAIMAVVVLFFLYLFIKVIISVISNAVFGKKVVCFVKDVKRIDKREKDNSIYESYLEVLCEYEYNGEKGEQVIRIEQFKDVESVKVGQRLVCKYNTQTKKIVPYKNEKTSIWFKICMTSMFMTFAYCIFVYEKGLVSPKLDDIIIWILFLIVWYSGILNFMSPYRRKGSFIKLKGKVVEYHVISNIEDNDILWDYYAPEIQFKYNDKEYKMLSERYNVKKPYPIGQEVDVYYDPETNSMYEKLTNPILIINAFIPPVIGIIELIKYLVK